MKSRTRHILLPPLLVFLASMILAESLVRFGIVRQWLLPPPTSVFHAVWEQRDLLLRGLLRTAEASVAGFALSAIVGVSAAVIFSTSRRVQRAFYPYAIFFQTVPVIAIAPQMVIWLGYGVRTVIASAFIVSVFPVIANTLSGLLSVDPALRDLFRLHGAGGWATLWKLKLPSSLPQILTGLRIAAGLAVIGAIVGEFFAGGGLGSAMQPAIRMQQSDVVFAIVLLGSVLGLALFGLVNLAGYFTLRRWHASERN
ncbi:MAG: ABC transporter permease [Phycisphaeraceae bacterium]|nr:ABC transporter permease [Phycisphaeraceae bacterium]